MKYVKIKKYVKFKKICQYFRFYQIVLKRHTRNRDNFYNIAFSFKMLILYLICYLVAF